MFGPGWSALEVNPESELVSLVEILAPCRLLSEQAFANRDRLPPGSSHSTYTEVIKLDGL